MRDLVTYRYVGSRSVVIDHDHAEGSTPLRRHLRTAGSISGTALAVSMLDTAGINVDPVYLLGLTQVDLQLYEPALEVDNLRTVGGVIRWARTQVFTECRFEDSDHPGRVIGSGAANWSVVSPTPEGFVYTDPGSGLPEAPDTPSMVEKFELDLLPDGGFAIPKLSPRIGSELLHHGPMLASIEQSALQAVTSPRVGEVEPALSSWTMRIVRAGRNAPFSATAELLTVTPAVIGCRCELRDGDRELIAVAHLSYTRKS
jgi:acyl-coenzyme A thioesterase PaaI-like protein